MSPADKAEFPNARPAGPGVISFGDGTDSSDSAEDRVVQLLETIYRSDDGIQPETILSAIGALAGFAAQEAVWEGVVRPNRLNVKQVFFVVNTKDGGTFYFGDFLNKILASMTEGELSIWRLVAAPAAQMACGAVPELKSIFEENAKNVGTPSFGVPVFPNSFRLKELPREALRHWPRVKGILLTANKMPLHWPLVLGVAAQKLILKNQALVPPDAAARIVMLAAVPMSHVNPATVDGGTMFP